MRTNQWVTQCDSFAAKNVQTLFTQGIGVVYSAAMFEFWIRWDMHECSHSTQQLLSLIGAVGLSSSRPAQQQIT